MITNEYYANLKGYENIYKISCYGTIINVKTHRILTPKYDKYGYLKVGLTKDGKQKYKFIHRLVAETFIPNPDNYPIVNHINGDKTNNHIDNLEWCTQQYNIKHAYRNGLKKGVSAEHKGSKNPKSKLTEENVLLILNNKRKGIDIRDSYSLFKNQISFKGFENIWYGYTWKHLVEKVDE